MTTNTAMAQEPATVPERPMQVRSLTIPTNDLPGADQLKIIRAVDGKSCGLKELQERIRQSMRELGYEDAQVEAPQLTATLEDRSTDVLVQVSAGPQYHLEEIKFQGTSVFPPDRLRGLFPVAAGDLFNVTAVQGGLEKLRKLYATKGHIDFVAIPQTVANTIRHTIMLVLDADEGKPYDFGRLLLDGPQPNPGIGEALLAAWYQFDGKRFNPELLFEWLAANALFLPQGEAALQQYAHLQPNPESNTVDIRLEFP